MTQLRLIPVVPPEVIKAANAGKLVVFVGAGASRIIGCSSWSGLAQGYISVLEGKLRYSELEHLKGLPPRQSISISRKIIAEKLLSLPDLSGMLKADPEKEAAYPIYKYLYEFHAINLTTNYDSQLDRYAEYTTPSAMDPITSGDSPEEEAGAPPIKRRVFYQEPDLTIDKLENGNVIHIHGSEKDQKGVVLTLSEYLGVYNSGSAVTTLLDEVFKRHTVLFVGYGLEEVEILEQILRHHVKEAVPRHFWLYPALTEEKNFLKFTDRYYKDLGVEILPYDISKKGYPQLYHVIKSWSKTIGPASRDRSTVDKLAVIDSVL